MSAHPDSKPSLIAIRAANACVQCISIKSESIMQPAQAMFLQGGDGDFASCGTAGAPTDRVGSGPAFRDIARQQEE